MTRTYVSTTHKSITVMTSNRSVATPARSNFSLKKPKRFFFAPAYKSIRRNKIIMAAFEKVTFSSLQQPMPFP